MPDLLSFSSRAVPMTRPPHPLSTLALAAGCALALGLGSPGAHAQDTAQEAANRAQQLQQQQQQRQERELERLRQRGEGVRGLPLESLRTRRDAAGQALPGRCHPIETIEVDGAPRLPEWQLRELVQPQQGKCLGAAEIESLLASLTEAYLQRGMVAARVYLPTQDLSSGRLRLQAVEGRVARVEVRDGGQGSVNVDGAFPNVVGEPVRLRVLEQGIDQINRLQSNRATLDIEPGARPGESVVVVKNTPGARWHLGMGLDNQGDEATGRDQLTLALGIDRLFGINEFIGVTHRRSLHQTDRRQSSSNSLDFVLPIGAHTFSLGTSHSTYASEVLTAGGLSLIADGHNDQHSARLDHLLWRSERARWAANWGVTVRETFNRLAGQELAVASRRLAVADLELVGEFAALGGRLRMAVGYARGMTNLGAMRDAPDLPDWVPRAQFEKARAQLQWRVPLQLPGGLEGAFSTQWTAQHASVPLYGSEQISVGSLYTVRGFRQGLSGDHGFYARNELSVSPNWVVGGHKVGARLYAGLDFGAVRGRVPTAPQGRLVGAALGAQVQVAGLALELSHTRALKNPSALPKESGQTWISINQAF